MIRLERTTEELLDDLNNWEKHVDPKDIEELEAAGVKKEVIDESLRAIRYNNKTFGSLDSSLRSETFDEEKDIGDDYRELVQEYIATLKECLATPENPGQLYEGLHFPGEKFDHSAFDYEKERQQKLEKRRSGQS